MNWMNQKVKRQKDKVIPNSKGTHINENAQFQSKFKFILY